ncbi:MAG: RseA family anti-sigma factor [Proteobacteria bacterium]|nr:RseA family anti-sigma factor [Pseudomonadota bacterium]MDA0993410.1 RseA family anti-sigma factor [Pseudomonadota bacterium]
MQISAFVDGELPDNESEFLLRRLSQDAAMRQQVAEFLAIGRLIRREQEVPGMNSLRGRIAAALGQAIVSEEVEPAAVGSALMTPASGIAVAATVAAIALVGLSQLGGPVAHGLADDAVAIDLAPAYTEPTAEQVLANSPTERLIEYSRRHDSSSPDLASNGILSRMVTFELREGRLVEIEPDPHLVSGDGQPAVSGQDDRLSNE